MLLFYFLHISSFYISLGKVFMFISEVIYNMQKKEFGHRSSRIDFTLGQ